MDRARRFRVAGEFALRVLVWLLSGAAWTVVVCWGLALWSPLKRVEIEHGPALAGARLSSATTVPSDWDLGCGVFGWGPGVRYELVSELHWMGSTIGALSGKQNRSIERVAVGWPVAAMEWAGTMDERARSASASAAMGGSTLQPGIRVPGMDGTLYMGAERRLPLVALWPSFGVSAAVWGVVLWAAWRGAGAWRRQRRRGRGLCEGCAYPVGAGERCSECGRPVLRRAGGGTSR
jgi:hypothetical protein